MQRWQDKVGVVLGVLLFISPWVIGFATAPAAAWSAWIIGVATVVFFGIAVSKPREWEEWVNLVLAAIMLVVPFIFGFSELGGATATFWVLGILIGADAIWALVQARQTQHHGTA